MQANLKFDQAFTFLSEARSVIELQDSLEEMVRQGIISLNEDQIKAAVAKKVQDLATKYDQEMKDLDAHASTQALKDLAEMDFRGSTWTNEDSDATKMNEYLKLLQDAEKKNGTAAPGPVASQSDMASEAITTLPPGVITEKYALNSSTVLLNNHMFATEQRSSGLMQAVTLIKSGLVDDGAAAVAVL